jgi:uncharacterized membrane-anchored protein YhcB (DUF1043 family)
MDWTQIAEKFGMPAIITIAVIYTSYKLGKWVITKFFEKWENEMNERKAITNQYQGFLENHITEHTQAMKDLTQSIKDLAKDNNQAHQIIIEKLK